MTSIVVTGPESCGKTILSQQLAEYFQTDWLPEFSRKYLEKLGRDYVETDLVEIAKGQLEAEQKFAEQNGTIRIFDTSFEVLKIWSEVVYKRCDSFIQESLEKKKKDLYLLCCPDLPWEPDPLRENPNDRDKLLTLYIEELTRLNVNFVKIEDHGKQRFENALTSVLHFQKLKLSNQ